MHKGLPEKFTLRVMLSELSLTSLYLGSEPAAANFSCSYFTQLRILIKVIIPIVNE